jgi:hypothetical protein
MRKVRKYPVADHPGEKDFGEHIRGKRPAHPHHTSGRRGGDYTEGGATGFNLQDDFAGTGGGQTRPESPNVVAQTPPADSGEVRPSSQNLVGGVDFTVPSYREGEAERPQVKEPGT